MKNQIVPLVVILYCVADVFGTNPTQSPDLIHFRLGVKYQNEQKDDQAIEEFRTALASSPENYTVYYHIAQVYARKGQYRLAIYNLRKALSYNPGWSKATKELAALYEMDSQYYNAVKELQNFYQICDPAERDSIQTQIKRLIEVMRNRNSESNTSSKEATSSIAKPDTQPLAQKVVLEKKTKSVQTTDNAVQTKNNLRSPAQPIENNQRVFTEAVALYSKGIDENNSMLIDSSFGILKKIVKKKPTMGGAHFYIGLIERERNQSQAAKESFKKSLSYPVLGITALFYLGKIYGEEKKYKEAIASLNSYIQKTDYEPGKKEAEKLVSQYRQNLENSLKDTVVIDIAALTKQQLHREIATIHEQKPLKNIEIIIDSLYTLSIVDTNSEPGALMTQAVRDFNAAEIDKSIEEFRKVLAQFPRKEVMAACTYDLGICYMRLQNYGNAQTMFSQVQNNYPQSPLAIRAELLKAICSKRQRESNVAEKQFQAFIQGHRGHALVKKAYEELGDFYGEQTQYKRAIDAYETAAALFKTKNDRVNLYSKIGDSYTKVENYSRAIDAFQKVLTGADTNVNNVKVADAYYKVADIYFKQKNYSKALSSYTSAVDKFPQHTDNPWGLFQIASIYKIQKNYEQAIKMFNHLISRYPQDYWATQAKWKLEDATWEHEYKAVLH